MVLSSYIFLFISNVFDFQGTTTYFSSNCDVVDAKVAQEFMSAKVSLYTRVVKLGLPFIWLHAW